ncbi:hypothetical protein Dimus_034919 [Dionaea muscipula]
MVLGTFTGNSSSGPDDHDLGRLPYSYKALPGDGRRNEADDGMINSLLNGPRWPVRIGLVILSGLLMLVLLMTLLGQDNKIEVIKMEANAPTRNDIPVTVPPEDNVEVHVVRGQPTKGSSWMPGSRGKDKGVSEKTNQLPYHGLRGKLVSEWNVMQLAWQRTTFHFQPDENWMNDPNGPLMYKGWYHFFYQYNPNGPVWGDIVWGHAVSKDLIRWTHVSTALLADAWYDANGVWTGSATVLPGGKIAMLYTGSTNDTVQVQNLAYPADPSDPLLISWVKYPENPVLVPPPGIDPHDFRDPTTAWYTAAGKWRFSIGSKVNRTGIALVYETADFKTFELVDGVLHAVAGTGMWECVDFYPVSTIDPKGMDTSVVHGPHVKHVLKASLDDDRNDYYAIGRYDEERRVWVPDSPEIDVGIGLKYDYGKYYASKTFYDEVKRRRVLWGWVPESDSEAADIRKGWASVQAIPRRIWFDQETGSNLLIWPVEEVEGLRRSRKDFVNIVVQAGSSVPLDVGFTTELDIIAEFEIDREALERLPASDEQYSCSSSGGAAHRGAVGPFGLLVLTAEDFSEQTPIYFYVTKGNDGNLKTSFCTDLSRSSMAVDVVKDITGSTVPVLRGEKLSVRILIDHSIVEAFAQGGRTCITSRVYPTKAIHEDAKLFLFNNATEATITASINTWQMSPASMVHHSIVLQLLFISLTFIKISYQYL